MSLNRLLNAANEMIERRDRMRSLHGQDYAQIIQEPRRIVKAIADRDNISVIAAALHVCKVAEADGHGSVINLVIAAAVDLIEEQE